MQDACRVAKFFFLPWFCRFITSHPVSQPSVSFSALNFDLIRSIHRQLGTMVLGKVRLLLSCGKISLAVVEQAWKNITKHKQLVNKLRLTLNNNSSSRSSAKAPQQNTYKPQIVHRIGENKMKIQATGVKCKMKQSKQVFHKMSKTIRSP